MRRTPAPLLLAIALLGGRAQAQVLDDTLVPRGQLRLQAHPTFATWGSRFGRSPDGRAVREELGEDLTDPTGLSLFPGVTSMTGYVADITGAPYTPTLGSAVGRLSHDVTRIDFGGHLGVFDWLTVGIVVPWMQTRTALDFNFEADTTGAADLGVSPALTNAGGVSAYLAALTGAASAAQANADAVCGGGGGAPCAAAQALAGRATSLLGSAQGAYGASLFFPLDGSSAAAALALASAGLDADLTAAGLAGISSPMVFATEAVTSETILSLPSLAGGGIEGAALGSRRGLWTTGDVEVTTLVRLLDGGPRTLEDARGGLAYLLTAGLLVRLPTGTPEHPDIFLDLGTGDGQLDVEGRANAALAWRRLALVAGVRYGLQRPATLTRRVAPPEVPVPPLSTRALLRFRPAPYLSLDVAPSIRLTDELTLTGQLRVYNKGRDVYELVDPTLPLDPAVLEAESAVQLTQVGGGLRYTTVERWRDGVPTRPMELHFRLLRSAAGGGGQTPVSTRVEVGIRLFRRFWGPERPSR